MYLLALLLVTQLAIPIKTDNDIRVTPLANPIFPFSLGGAYVTSRSHVFVKHIDLKTYESKLDEIQKILSETIVCRYCTDLPSLERLKITINDTVNLAFEKLGNFNSKPRNKRALINVVGRVEKWLFGTLSDEDGERYDNAIETLKQNQLSIYNDQKNSITVTKEFVNETTELLHKVKANNEYLEKQVSKLHRTIDDITTYLTSHHILNSLMQNCELLMGAIDNLQTSVTLAQMHTLTTSILPLTGINEIKGMMHQMYSNQISFKDNRNYYRYLFTEVGYIDSEILILIHFPITEITTLELYHLFPIPINNLTLIPEKPYLLLNATEHLYQEEPCHSIDEYCIANVNKLLTPPDCVVDILRGQNQNCTLTPIYTNTDLISPINSKYLIVIPLNTLKMQQTCRKSGFTDIRQPTLVRIPYRCKIEINGNLFINDQTRILGSPFTLPQIPITRSEATRSEVHVYQEIDLHHLTSVQRRINQLEVKPLKEETSTTTSIWTYLIIFILIILSLYSTYKVIKCYKQNNNPFNYIVSYVKGKPSNSEDSDTKNQSISDKNDVFP